MSDFLPINTPPGRSSDSYDNSASKHRQCSWFSTPKRRRTVTVSGVLLFLGLSVLMGFTLPGSPKLPAPWNHISATIGWIYFWAWSISFYPQVYSNYVRKSVVGLSYDYVAYNILGFVSYTVFNCLFRWATSVQREYERQHDGHSNKIALNDVVFALHAVALTVITLAQIVVYDTGKHPLSRGAKLSTGMAWAVVVAYAVVCGALNRASGVFSWYTFAYFLSYIKLVISFVKYIPQVLLNYRRKTTAGWSMENVMLDIVGGCLSVVQLVMDSGIDGDWSGITGDPVKFGLGLLSIGYDTIFLLQHYVWYPVTPTQRSPSGPDHENDHIEFVSSPHAGEADTTQLLADSPTRL